MQHALQMEGFGVRLRPVRLEDAPFIVWLRGLDHVKGRIGDSAADAAGQQAWLEKYFARAGDYYFVIETAGGVPVGAYGVYDIVGTSAESGRWIVRPEVPAAIPSAMLAFDLAFGRLGLSELRVKTVATNRSVLSLNRKFGLRQTGITPAGQVIGGKPVDLVHFLLRAQDWADVREGIRPLAELAGKQVLEWEQTQTVRLGEVNPFLRGAMATRA
jgi:RimJ/RimL family protein N-acetyltransferase